MSSVDIELGSKIFLNCAVATIAPDARLDYDDRHTADYSSIADVRNWLLVSLLPLPDVVIAYRNRRPKSEPRQQMTNSLSPSTAAVNHQPTMMSVKLELSLAGPKRYTNLTTMPVWMASHHPPMAMTATKSWARQSVLVTTK